ncbi:hypothetical protein [Nocardia seriolae]|uniref:Uncharacterized protein n=1 Tax=Nocardia seriolae TaxID=37332 RepID=A0A0B8N4L1_9NOCA|nr:hypothetical protein [Nocardia seriolae]GEM24407.1 hypothetical protein NS2_26460 [Nocardia seriolae NBRC 15557]APA94419.1 hypothetical protein NS506_00335 [Nocardia seriolae]MTJ66610.1 hypothetical protein [Nocardia seriolae]MTJ71938.1 hypothetical protein [Nocardia seriolae]MTJ84739.1 hypothetical protein [Nocardia seriolae]
MDIVELRTPTAIVRHGNGRLTVLRPGTDGERVLDVPVSDLLKVRLNRRADDAVVIEIYLRYPTPVLTGVPADRTPLPVLIAEHDVPAATVIVERINNQILATQRLDVAAPDLTPPAPSWGRTGPARADVDRAVRRMAPKRDAKPAVAALQRYVTPDEYVLETALVTTGPPAPKATGLLAVTTTRLIFVSLGAGKRFAHELPVATLLWARTTDDADTPSTAPADYGVEVSDGNLTWQFSGTDRADTDRVTGALNFAIQREVADGAAGPADPGVSKLYSEWELLVERHSLGMVDDAQFQRYGRGILRSLPD